MEEQKGKEVEIHYYSNRLKNKLHGLLISHTSVVEAPSGYGKTTAVQEYLENGLSPDTPICWYAAVEEEPSSAYRRLCRTIAQFDAGAGGRLMEIGLPNAATVGDAGEILRNLHCQTETWLVLDNVQLILDILPFPLLDSFLAHREKQLHIVLITQILRRDLLAFLNRHGVLHITQKALSLSAGEIQEYYRTAGVGIGDEDAAYVAHHTGGWIAAVYLHLCALREHGKILDTVGILSLMEHSIWDGLTDTQQAFLLRISLFETVTAAQAAFLCGGMLSEEARQVLRISFIRFDPVERQYVLHELFSELLREKLQERGAAFKRECFARAGDWCREDGQPLRAMGFYIDAKDFERILSQNLSEFYTQTIQGVPFYEVALRLFHDCPEDAMREHPLSMLHVAYALLVAGKEEEYSSLLDRLRPMMTAEGGEKTWLLADWILLSSYRKFPDLPQMIEILKQASELFGSRNSRVIFPDSPWCYSPVTPFALFHTAPGESEREAQALEKYFTLYSGMTGGHGAGAEILFRVERAHYACNFQEAEILAYKAAFVAQSHKQEIIRMAATFHLAWLAARKGDSAGWRHAFSALTGASEHLFRQNFALPSAADTVRGILLSELGMADERASEWLREGNFSAEQLPGLELLRNMLHFGILLHRRDFPQLVGTAAAVYPNGISVERFGDVFPALTVASGYAGLGRKDEAMALIRRAAAFALPDGLYTQLIVYDRLSAGLVEQCIRTEFQEHWEAFGRAKENMQETFASIYPSFSTDELPKRLTAREREVALLAASGLTNEEIAGKLSLTVSTVRTHLRSVFRKLNVDRRTKLADKLR